nr:hypothetical protein BaRGS_021877 [Batillaria attramentaria]
MSDSQLGPLENSLEFSPPLSVSQLEDESRPRAAAEEVTTPPRESVTAQMGTPHVPSPSTPPIFDLSNRLSGVRSFQTTTTVEETNSERHISIIEVKSPSKPPRDWTTTTTQQQHEHNPLGTFTGGNPFGSGGGNTLERERGVVLGVNSLRRHHLDREQQQQQHQVLGSPRYFNTPAPCSEDSTPKRTDQQPVWPEITTRPAILEHKRLHQHEQAGIRTAPHCGVRQPSKSRPRMRHPCRPNAQRGDNQALMKGGETTLPVIETA